MKQKTLFRGIATALATPMTSSGAIDYDAYGRLIDWQIESGTASPLPMMMARLASRSSHAGVGLWVRAAISGQNRFCGWP